MTLNKCRDIFSHFNSIYSLYLLYPYFSPFANKAFFDAMPIWIYQRLQEWDSWIDNGKSSDDNFFLYELAYTHLLDAPWKTIELIKDVPERIRNRGMVVAYRFWAKQSMLFDIEDLSKEAVGGDFGDGIFPALKERSCIDKYYLGWMLHLDKDSDLAISNLGENDCHLPSLYLRAWIASEIESEDLSLRYLSEAVEKEIDIIEGGGIGLLFNPKTLPVLDFSTSSTEQIFEMWIHSEELNEVLEWASSTISQNCSLSDIVKGKSILANFARDQPSSATWNDWILKSDLNKSGEIRAKLLRDRFLGNKREVLERLLSGSVWWRNLSRESVTENTLSSSIYNSSFSKDRTRVPVAAAIVWMYGEKKLDLEVASRLYEYALLEECYNSKVRAGLRGESREIMQNLLPWFIGNVVLFYTKNPVLVSLSFLSVPVVRKIYYVLDEMILKKYIDSFLTYDLFVKERELFNENINR